jgi:hypothetical protein
MTPATPSRRRRQGARLQQQFAQAPGLPFADLLAAPQVAQALRDEHVTFRQRLFAPLVTLWVFLSQGLDADHACAAAVARFLAWRAARGLAPCSADTAAYGKARRRLPEGVLARWTRASGRQLQDQAPPHWRWEGRTVKVVAGTTVSMPATPANQKAFPQSRSPKPGVGFPLARLGVLFSLAVGTVLDAAWGRYPGKQTGETALCHTVHDNLEPGDILLADGYFGSYGELALAPQRGADVVCRLHQRRRADVRRGRRLENGDHVVRWTKPARPAWMNEAPYAALPATRAVREVRVRVRHPGFRTKCLLVATTLLDPVATPPSDVAVRYRMRWLAELDLRALKQTLQMDVRRCQTPALVPKEGWAHRLASNRVRGLMARAADEAGWLPVQLRFKAAVQAVAAFAAVLWTAPAAELEALCQRLREILVSREVGHRSNRYEPRARKRRPKESPLVNESRQQARARLAAGS